jgi:soluble epoxide hydrolase/lipid-phosphate phosphatase
VKAQGNFTLPQPTFTLYPTKDPVADWHAFALQVKASSFLLQGENATIPTAHWPHEEMPAVFNGILEQWLTNKVKF